MSPELGLRKLVQESIEMVLDPVATSVRRVHHVLLEVARLALLPFKAAYQLTDSVSQDQTTLSQLSKWPTGAPL